MTRLAILSDIHGCLPALEQALLHLTSYAPDYYLLLGDILNHGPRNPLPQGYDPVAVATSLNHLRTRVIAVRGNCDSEVDQMLLAFPCLSPCNYLLLDSFRCCMTHGHFYSLEQLALGDGDVLLSGHSHQAGFSMPVPGVLAMNPGSISMPRQGPASFGLYENGTFSIRCVEDGAVLAEHVRI